MKIPRIIISALKGGGGKTLLSLGIVTALRKKGFHVGPFKKGPDYIDAMWLSLAAKNNVYNLDPYFLEDARLRALFQESMTSKDMAIIEGNRGLYDGKDILGTCSTASLAKTIDSPVILSVDCTKVTRTTAAMLVGMVSFDKSVKIAGVVLNNISSKRHESITRQCIEHYTDLKVMGVIYRLLDNPLPERHMGLVAFNSNNSVEIENLLLKLAGIIENSLDLQNIIDIAHQNSHWTDAGDFWVEDVNSFNDSAACKIINSHNNNTPCEITSTPNNILSGQISDLPHNNFDDEIIKSTNHSLVSEIIKSTNHKLVDEIIKLPQNSVASENIEQHNSNLLNENTKQYNKGLIVEDDNLLRQGIEKRSQESQKIHNKKPIIGYVRDAALWFYYNENLEALSRAGAELVELSMLATKRWPKMHGLYLGGGYPEEFAENISCSSHLEKIRELSLAGNPIYAECGGFMILANSLIRNNVEYPMAKIFPCKTYFNKKPQGLGYVEVKIVAENVFHPMHTTFRGHEFHYSQCEFEPDAEITTVFVLTKGVGMGNGKDGLLKRNTFASYTHLYAPAMPSWAKCFVHATKKMVK